jgi:filamentous hemagglutinin family protein
MATVALSANCAVLAQVVPDQTLPVGERSQISGDPNFQIDGGAIRGSNLFHSFQAFSIPIGSSVVFNNDLSIANIISRVTGNSISNIDGLIRANGTANLFLINPNGILFGNNARLEIGGSFSASTADSVKFADGFEFSAIAPQPLLTISAPLGFQYGSNPGEIRSQGAQLQVPDGQSLTLAGGAIAINGGKLSAPGGRVELTGRGDVAIGSDAEVDVRSGGGGSIAITGRNLTVTGTGTRIRAGIAADSGTVGAQAGNIDINVTEAVKLDATAKSDRTVISNTVAVGATGNAGDINITAGQLALTNGAIINTTTDGLGNAGNITILAQGRTSFDGFDANIYGSGLYSWVGDTARGQGGNIRITTGSLFVTDGAVSGDVNGRGNAGDITIVARDTVSFSGLLFYLGSAVVGEGKGGNFSITANSLLLRNGARIDMSTYGIGNGGNVNLDVGDIVLDGFYLKNGGGLPTSILSNVQKRAIGNAGNITIRTNSLTVIDGALVESRTRSLGDAGDIDITVRGPALFTGKNPFEEAINGSGVYSVVDETGIGKGGNINLTANSLTLGPSGRLNSSTSGQGKAGNIIINSKSLLIQDGATVSVESRGQGIGGNIRVQADRLKLNNKGSITAESNQGGNIRLDVKDLILLRRNSKISATAGTAQAGGDGGNITLNSNFIVAITRENSDIQANAFTGIGGTVQITTQGVLGIEPRSRPTPFSDITASSDFGISGTILLNSPDIDPSRGTATLPTGLVDTNALIANSCVARRNRQGRFIITGTGGLATQPDDLANAAFPTYELIPEVQQASVPTESDRIYQLATGEIVLGRSCQ